MAWAGQGGEHGLVMGWPRAGPGLVIGWPWRPGNIDGNEAQLAWGWLCWAGLCCAVLSRSRAALELERKSRKEEEQKEQINPKGRTEKKREWKGIP